MQGTKMDHGRADAGRVVPVPPGLQALLRAMPKRIDTPLLFPSGDGRLWYERRFYDYVWYPAQESTGLKVRPHDMRHSYVSLMRAAGVDPADLAQATGHTVLTATGKYTHSVGATFEAMRLAVPS
jgi:integrase